MFILIRVWILFRSDFVAGWQSHAYHLSFRSFDLELKVPKRSNHFFSAEQMICSVSIFFSFLFRCIRWYNGYWWECSELNSIRRGCPRDVMVKTMDCGIVVSEFELQSRYYVHFRTNTLGKGMNPLTLRAMGLIVPLLLENTFSIK